MSTQCGPATIPSIRNKAGKKKKTKIPILMELILPTWGEGQCDGKVGNN